MSIKNIAFVRYLFYILPIMNRFSTKHWESEDQAMEEKTSVRITDVDGATKILGISRITLISWESLNVVRSFKSVYNGRLRKCFKVDDLETLAGRGDEIPVS